MMSRRITLFIGCMLVFTMSCQLGCNNGKESANKTSETTDNKNDDDKGHHDHGADELHWGKKDLEHEGFVISLGHHGNHWHDGDQIEPAAMLVKDGKNIGDAKLTCQLVDGETAIDTPAEMIFEPKTDSEPAHYAGAKLTFPSEKEFLVKFEITLPGGETYSDSIKVRCGH